jgi:hypothetical protein
MLEEILTLQKYFFAFDGFREILTNLPEIMSSQKAQNTKMNAFMFISNYL